MLEPGKRRFKDFTDTGLTRSLIKEKVKNALEKFHKIHKNLKLDKRYRLKFDNISVPDKEFHIDDQKAAILKNKYLTLPIRGNINLIDDNDKTIESLKSGLIGRLPYYTGRGTFIYNGNEYTSNNQFRLKPGIYSRVKSSGDLESHFNVNPLTGLSFRINMAPRSGRFNVNFHKANANLYALLSGAGISDDAIKKSWGDQILKVNKSKIRADELDRIYTHLFGTKAKGVSQAEKAKKIFARFTEFKIDPGVTERTLGKKYTYPTPEAILRASTKILNINRGKEEPDDRDSLEFRTVHSVEDYLAEKLHNHRFAYNLLRKLKRYGLKDFPNNVVTGQLASLIKADSRTQPIEETNPLEILDQQERFTVLGEGGISSLDSIPVELRNVHPSHLGFVDPVRGPESAGVGIDTRITYGSKKGLHDNHLYTQVLNAKTGKHELIRTDVLAKSKRAFPHEYGKNKVHVIDADGKIVEVNKKDVDYYLEHPSNMMSTLSNLVPMSSAVQGNRLFMAGKVFSQILPLKYGEPAITRSKVPDKEQSFDNLYGKKINGAISKIDGEVSRITKSFIFVKDKRSDKEVKHGKYYYFPLNRKTQMHHEMIVKVGDKVKKGQVLAKTQYTDRDGTLKIGKNLRVAFLPMKGLTFEDGIVVSEAAAKKLTSEHMYTYQADLKEKGVIAGKRAFISLFPTHYTRDQLVKITDNGAAKVGAKLAPGDPIILLAKKKQLSTNDLVLKNISKKLEHQLESKAIEWEHNEEGVVVDVDVGLTYIKVNLITHAPASVGDKLTGRYGNKGVISAIISDGETLTDEAGKKIEVMLNPMGLISRINPAQIYETLLGKIADRTDSVKKYLVDSFFTKEKVHDFVQNELKKHNVKDTDDLLDPMSNKKIKNIMTGKMFILKPHKTSEEGASARDIGTYTADFLPMKGGKEGAKRIGNMECSALLAHNAVHNLRDVITIKGQKNDDYWRAMRLGRPLPTPQTPFMYEKFLNSLKAGGINVERDGTQLKLMPLIDKDVDELSSGEIRNFKMVRTSDMKVEQDGLFDSGVTGGLAGTRWGHINLEESMPSPLFFDYIAKILEMTEKKLMELYKQKGGDYIKELLSAIDLDSKEHELIGIIKKYKSTKRDNAIKSLRFVRGLKKAGRKLDDLVLSKIPVIPPVYRPLSFIGSSMTLVPDANNLYKDLIVTRDAYKTLKQELPYEMLDKEREDVYRATKAVFGVGDPVSIKNKQKKLKGFLKQVFGLRPKLGMFQQKVIAKPQDLAGRAVAVPSGTLDLNQLGIPEKIAWKMYSPFVMRRLVRSGMSAVVAANELETRGPIAKRMLDMEIRERPIFLNRAPTLHKFNISAFFPVLHKEEVIAAPALICASQNLDFDGDACNLQVPVSDAAKNEAINMLPSHNLLNPSNMSPMYKPGHESVYGTWKASEPKQEKPIRTFKTKKDAFEAYKRGEISINDAIEIKELVKEKK